MVRQSYLRKLFLAFFPVLIILGFFLIFNNVRLRYEQENADQKQKIWLERTEFAASKVRAEFTIALQLKKAGILLGDVFARQCPSRDSEAEEFLRAALNRYLITDGFERLRVWAFLANDRQKLRPVNGTGLERELQRIMQRAGESLNFLAENSADIAGEDVKKQVRALEGVFGENSSPIELANFREGIPTPVDFSGQPVYLFWKRLNSVKSAKMATILCLVPIKTIENPRRGLQVVADQIFSAFQKRLAVIFVRHDHFSGEIESIFPALFHENSREKQKLINVLGEKLRNKTPELRKPMPAGGYVFYLDNIDISSPWYLAVVSSSAGSEKAEHGERLNLLFVFIAFAWLFFYFFRLYQGQIISLSLSFRLFFFLTGMLPAVLAASLAYFQIREVREIQKEKLLKAGYGKLDNINESIAGLATKSSENLKLMLEDVRLQNLILANDNQSLDQAFAKMHEKLRNNRLQLAYLMVIKPGESGKILAAEGALKSVGSGFLNYYAVSSKVLGEKIAPKAEKIILTPVQIDLLNSFGNRIFSREEDAFLDSIEKVTSYKSGSDRQHLYFTSIIVRNAVPEAFVVAVINLSASLENLFSEFLQKDQQPGYRFHVVKKEAKERLATIPTLSQNFLGSETGRTFRSFCEASANAVFPLSLQNKHNLFFFVPFNKSESHFGAGIIDLSTIYAEESFKLVILLLALSLLATIIYGLSVSVTGLMIEPLHGLDNTFTALSAGRLENRFKYNYKNELGFLATSTDHMITGLRRRRLLGKFVSSTFENDIADRSKDLQAQMISGSVLFSDIRGFTAISEAWSPQIVAETLNRHLRDMVEVITDGGGKIEQFIGDAIVAFFPGTGSADRMRAIAAAAAMMRRNMEFNSSRKSEDLSFQIGIGIESGQVMSGILRTRGRSEFTILGAARTSAERFEGLSKKACFTRIVFSAATAQLCAEAGIETAVVESGEPLEAAYELKSLELDFHV
jgi:class 3 adenylate cyclase